MGIRHRYLQFREGLPGAIPGRRSLYSLRNSDRFHSSDNLETGGEYRHQRGLRQRWGYSCQLLLGDQSGLSHPTVGPATRHLCLI